jgi:hypothetical protein
MWLHWGVFVGISNLHIAIMVLNLRSMGLVKLNVACVCLVKKFFEKKFFESKNILVL